MMNGGLALANLSLLVLRARSDVLELWRDVCGLSCMLHMHILLCCAHLDVDTLHYALALRAQHLLDEPNRAFILSSDNLSRPRMER